MRRGFPGSAVDDGFGYACGGTFTGLRPRARREPWRMEMDEDALNLQIRRFLKKVGITSQREIEKAVREAAEGGTLGDAASVKAVMTLSIPDLGLELDVEDVIALR